jgi:hypothetical protein
MTAAAVSFGGVAEFPSAHALVDQLLVAVPGLDPGGQILARGGTFDVR